MADPFVSTQIVLALMGTFCYAASFLMFKRAGQATLILATRPVENGIRQHAEIAMDYIARRLSKERTAYNSVHDIVISVPFLFSVPFLVGLVGVAAFYGILGMSEFGFLLSAMLVVFVLRAFAEPQQAIDYFGFIKYASGEKIGSLSAEDVSHIADAKALLRRGAFHYLILGSWLFAIVLIDRFLGGYLYPLMRGGMSSLPYLGGLSTEGARFLFLVFSVVILAFLSIRIWRMVLRSTPPPM